MRPQTQTHTDRQSDRRAWPLYISRRLRLTRNVNIPQYVPLDDYFSVHLGRLLATTWYLGRVKKCECNWRQRGTILWSAANDAVRRRVAWRWLIEETHTLPWRCAAVCCYIVIIVTARCTVPSAIMSCPPTRHVTFRGACLEYFNSTCSCECCRLLKIEPVMQNADLKPNSITLAGSKLVRSRSPTSFEPVCDQLRTTAASNQLA